jgi:2'-deoxynucleoside 5'-phosphate N-hydrolase
MKIYFTASSRLVGANPKLYSKMYSYLSAEGKMVSDKVLKWTKVGVKDISKSPLKFKKINYIESVNSVKKADIIFMEVSGHSMSMGYLVGKALEMNKPVIVLHNKQHVPNYIKGISDQKLIISEYGEENVEVIMGKALKKASGMIDVRFNFFVNSKILNYLDWVAHKKMLPRSVFLRNLIEKEIKKDKEFKS